MNQNNYRYKGQFLNGLLYLFLLLAGTLLVSIILKQSSIIDLQQEEQLFSNAHVEYLNLQIGKHKNSKRLIVEEEGNYLNPLKTIVSEDKDSLPLRNIVHLKTKLIFRFSERQCNPCIDTVFNILNEMNDFFNFNGILMSSFDNPLKIKRYKLLNDICYKTYNADFIIGGLDSLNLPYFFVITPELRVERIFFPDNDLPDLTKRYIQKIQSDYGLYSID